MKKYYTLGDLLVDFRKRRSLTQIDFSAMLDVDVRTLIRWEKNESLIRSEKEKILIENFGLPHQVIRNLNTDKPIPIYFDFERWMYSLTLLSSMVKSSNEFKTNIEYKTSRIVKLADKKDYDFISYIQKNQKNCTPLSVELIKKATELLPELNFVIRDQSGFHGGHVSVLPLKYESYAKIRDQEMNENQLTSTDLSLHATDGKRIFYFYSIYSNSVDNTYYLVNKMMFYYKKRNDLKDYIFAGITFQKLKVERFREMGIQVIWEKSIDEYPDRKATFVSGNFNQFFSNDKDCF